VGTLITPDIKITQKKEITGVSVGTSNLTEQNIKMSNSLAGFIPENLTEINVASSYAERFDSYVIYDNSKIEFGEFLSACKGIKIKQSSAYKLLPANCQILFGIENDRHISIGYVCSTKSCIRAKFDYLLDVETGEEMPVPDTDFK
jgi:hypothetical protein